MGFFALGFLLRSTIAVRDVSFWRSMTITPEPTRCALCGNGDRPWYHAPCLIKLATGEIGELRVYDPDPQRAGGLALIQQSDTFSLLPCADLVGYRDTGAHVSHVSVPEEREPMDPAVFCRDCRALLAAAATEGYLLLDLYEEDGITLYPIADGAQYVIRDYAVSVSGREGAGELEVNVAGLLP